MTCSSIKVVSVSTHSRPILRPSDPEYRGRGSGFHGRLLRIWNVMSSQGLIVAGLLVGIRWIITQLLII